MRRKKKRPESEAVAEPITEEETEFCHFRPDLCEIDETATVILLSPSYGL